MPSVRLFLVVPAMMIAVACSGTRQSASDFIRRGDEQVSAGRYSAAIIEYRNAVRKEPSRAEAYRKLGDAYMEEGKLEEAYHAFTNATGLIPGGLLAVLADAPLGAAMGTTLGPGEWFTTAELSMTFLRPVLRARSSFTSPNSTAEAPARTPALRRRRCARTRASNSLAPKGLTR